MKLQLNHGWKAVLKRFLWFLIICVSIIGASLASFALIPGKYSYKDGDWNYSFVPTYNSSRYNVLFDPHSHTRQSSGVLTPEQNIQYHLAMGYNACVITDKLGGDVSSWESTREAQRIARVEYGTQIKILIGIEWGSNRGHFNIILPPNTTDTIEYRTTIPYYGSNPTDVQIQDFIQAVHGLGGIVIIDHLLYSLPIMPAHPSRQELFNWGVDYIEVINAADFDQVSNVFCTDTGMGKIATTGMHVPEKDKIHGWTLLNTTTFSEQAVFDELKNKRADVIYQPHAAPYNATHVLDPGYVMLRPLIQLGAVLYEYFPGAIGFDGLGFAVVILDLVALFAVVEVLRFASVHIARLLESKKQK
jgi:hypothetical protein